MSFVARSGELATARTVLARARDGSSDVLVIGGEAGVGRTRLVEVIADTAQRDGFRVATGTCVRMDAGAMPYLAIIAALRALVAHDDPATIAVSLAGQRREIARLLPELARLGVPVDRAPADRPPSVRVGSPATPAPAMGRGTAGAPEAEPLERLRLFEAVTTWLARLAESAPLLLVIEDLQWVDASTLDLLRAMTPALAPGSVLVVTLRTDLPLPGGVGATVAELVRDGATRIELAPFGREELATLVAAATGTDADSVDPAALDVLLERSGGNAFLALALIDAGLVSGETPYGGVPPSLRDILDAELASLDEATLAMLRAAALDPGPVDDEVLAHVLGEPVGAVGRTIREARDAGILAIGPSAGSEGIPRFRHALQREVLVDQLGRGERRSLHARFADALESADPDPSRAAAVAFHRDGADDGRRALSAHLVAMDAAERALAFDAAAAHGARAAALRHELGAADPGSPDEAGLLERASFDALVAGDPRAAADLARRALTTSDIDAARSAALHDRIRWALWLAGDRAGSASELDLAFERLGDAPADAARARLLAERAAMRMDEADPRAAEDLAEEAIGIARRVGALDVEALGLGILGRSLATHGRVDEGIANLRAAVGIADRIGNLQGRMVGLATIVAVLAGCGRSREALAEADAATAIADGSGLGRSLGASLAAEAARACFSLGEWDDADRRIADGLARRPAAPIEARLRIVALRLAAARGRRTAADAMRSRLDALTPVLEEAGDRASLDVALGELAIATDRPAEVRPLVDRAVTVIEGGAARSGSLAWLGVLAMQAEIAIAGDARARRDETAAAEAHRRAMRIAALADREASAVRQAWGDRAAALLAHVAAERSRIDGPAADRPRAWEQAVAAWEAIERPYVAAYARYRLAEAVLAAGGDRAAIAIPLRLAGDALRRLEARPLLAQVERLARLARIDLDGRDAGSGRIVKPADDPLATLDLTPREREVLRLVAEGWSNARIAEALGISTKTASVHVSNILAKLGAENRVEAAALVHRLGVADSQPPGG